MRKTLLLASLLFGALWLAAQTYPGQTQAPDRSTKAGQSQMTVEGCLNESNGAYTLTDSSGNVYQLVGAGSEISQQVGHTVKIIGLTGPASGSSKEGSSTGDKSAAPAAPPTLTVTSVKHVADSCSSNR